MSNSPTHELAQVFTGNLYQPRNISELEIDEIHQSLKRDSFACIRGLVSRADVKTAISQLKQRFSRNDDHPSRGESPEALKSNFQKLRIGTVPNMPHVSRFVRTFFNPLWAEDIYKMHGNFRTMAAVRNRLIGKPDNYACDQIEDGLWTAARIHQYPVGGGFMSAHRDSVVSDISRTTGLNYFQLLLIMSEKGTDFQSGGGFVESHGKLISFERACQLGDIIVYDENSLHGVEDIDPHKLLDLDTVSGRVVAFSTLYKSL